MFLSETELIHPMTAHISLLVYLGICVFRSLNALLISTQFDPDEYWQNLEPAYCEAFRSGLPCDGYTWEWLRRAPSLASFHTSAAASTLRQLLEGPVRSYLSILPTYLFYRAIQILHLDSTWIVARGPLIVNAMLVAAPTDWAVWSLAYRMRCSQQVKEASCLPWICLMVG